MLVRHSVIDRLTLMVIPSRFPSRCRTWLERESPVSGSRKAKLEQLGSLLPLLLERPVRRTACDFLFWCYLNTEIINKCRIYRIPEIESLFLERYGT